MSSILPYAIKLLAALAIVLSLIAFVSAGFVFDDIDFTEIQREAAKPRQHQFQTISIVVFLFSSTLLLLSNRISSTILNLFGKKS